MLFGARQGVCSCIFFLTAFSFFCWKQRYERGESELNTDNRKNCEMQMLRGTIEVIIMCGIMTTSDTFDKQASLWSIV